MLYIVKTLSHYNSTMYSYKNGSIRSNKVLRIRYVYISFKKRRKRGKEMEREII